MISRDKIKLLATIMFVLVFFGLVALFLFGLANSLYGLSFTCFLILPAIVYSLWKDYNYFKNGKS